MSTFDGVTAVTALAFTAPLGNPANAPANTPTMTATTLRKKSLRRMPPPSLLLYRSAGLYRQSSCSIERARRAAWQPRARHGPRASPNTVIPDPFDFSSGNNSEEETGSGADCSVWAVPGSNQRPPACKVAGAYCGWLRLVAKPLQSGHFRSCGLRPFCAGLRALAARLLPARWRRTL